MLGPSDPGFVKKSNLIYLSYCTGLWFLTKRTVKLRNTIFFDNYVVWQIGLFKWEKLMQQPMYHFLYIYLKWHISHSTHRCWFCWHFGGFYYFLKVGSIFLLFFSYKLCFFLFVFLVDYQTLLRESQTITAMCLHMKNLFLLSLFQVHLGVVHVVETFWAPRKLRGDMLVQQKR